jgi:hypothetical protein
MVKFLFPSLLHTFASDSLPAITRSRARVYLATAEPHWTTLHEVEKRRRQFFLPVAAAAGCRLFVPRAHRPI